jgi:hypothetical protein
VENPAKIVRRVPFEARVLLAWVEHLPLFPLTVAAVLMGGAPWGEEPHLWQKLKLLIAGELTQPLDVFDLALHACLPLVLLLKLTRPRLRPSA